MSSPPVSPEQRIGTGAKWFYWIAALSLVNSVAVAMGSDWGFVLGLGVTQVIDAIGKSFESGAATALAFAADLFVAALVVLTGYLAHRSRAVYVTGMVLYGLDALIYVLASDWLAVGFHGFVLFTMLPGIAAFGELRRAAAEAGGGGLPGGEVTAKGVMAAPLIPAKPLELGGASAQPIEPK